MAPVWSYSPSTAPSVPRPLPARATPSTALRRARRLAVKSSQIWFSAARRAAGAPEPAPSVTSATRQRPASFDYRRDRRVPPPARPAVQPTGTPQPLTAQTNMKEFHRVEFCRDSESLDDGDLAQEIHGIPSNTDPIPM